MEAIHKATEGYLSTVSNDGIYPISRIDVDIFGKLFSIIKKLGGNEQLLSILGNYKKLPDADILDLLTVFDSTFEGFVNKVMFIELNDQISLRIDSIYSFSKESSYDPVNNVEVFKIIVNKSNNIVTPYANTELKFLSENVRDNEYDRIKQRLKEFKNIMFL